MSVHQRLVYALLAFMSVHQRLVWALLANISVHQRLVWALLANISVHQRLVWALLANISVHQRFRKTALRASIPPPFLPQPKPWGRKGATRDQALGFRLWALGDQPNSPTRFISVYECSSAVGLVFISEY